MAGSSETDLAGGLNISEKLGYLIYYSMNPLDKLLCLELGQGPQSLPAPALSPVPGPHVYLYLPCPQLQDLTCTCTCPQLQDLTFLGPHLYLHLPCPQFRDLTCACQLQDHTLPSPQLQEH
ncbi:hypothetical protein P7K49_003162 [Saguinus oedipus]|uniref:Uncharacterized protein n=1 Tax=Saguinus oedipus TaxID=9490 RepID=A0ABQ9WKB6_SAGOE|nr:hypothetical protein P7K49_003162 [Saguinus oedipus]